MGEQGSNNLELEVAVVRGQQWVYRATFRPPAMISLGSSPSTVLALPDSDLPEYHELIRIYSDGGVLFFQPGMAVELRLSEGTKRNDELLDEGLAVRGGAGWKVPLGMGSKGTFRIAEIAVLFKVGPRSKAPVRAVRVGSPSVCAGCGAELSFAVVGFGALSPCQGCGVLNEVQPEGGADPALNQTELAPTIKRSAELPTFDAISVQKKVDSIKPFERVARERLSDLPTFDAISVRTAAVDPPRKAEGADLSAPTRRMREWGPMGSEDAATVLDVPTPDAPVVGADLPTFDAISALKKDEYVSTVGAMELLRGGSEEEPPVKGTVEATAPMGGTTHDQPVPTPGTTAEQPAPFLRETSSWEPGSEVEVVIEEEDEFFGEEPSVSLDLQRSYNAIPVLKRLEEAAQLAPLEDADRETEPAEPTPSEEFAAVKTRQVLVPKDMAGQAETLPELPGSSWTAPNPAIDRAQATAPSPPAPSPSAAPAPHMSVRPQREPEDLEGNDDDDFLMGRVMLPEVDPDRETNRWLIVVGAVSGVVGLALILYGLFG